MGQFMFKVIGIVILASVVSGCAFNPSDYDQLRQQENEHYRVLGA
mgnify:CR=1